ncbi:MAG: ShlB/FhaC/HecB family hemolysin secretion/activation protein, partial [Vampirovibrionales bacterium]
ASLLRSHSTHLWKRVVNYLKYYNPDVSIQPSVTFNPETHSVNVDLAVEEKRPIHLSAYWNNLDQWFYGGQTAGVSLISNNLTGNQDTLIVTAPTENRVHGVYTHYELPINKYGTRLGLDYSWGKANPIGSGWSKYAIRGRWWTLTGSVIQPLIAKENTRLSADINVDVRRSKTVSKYASLDTDGDGNNEDYYNTTIENTSIRSLRAGVNWTHHRAKDEFFVRQELGVGLPFAGASLSNSDNLENLRGGSQFFKTVGIYNYTRQLPKSLALVLNGMHQWSAQALPGSDVGALGGSYFTRGYNEAFLQADTFVYGSAELRSPLFLIPNRWKYFGTDERWRDKVTVLTFVDSGWGKVNNPDFTGIKDGVVVGTGGGLRLELNDYLSVRVDVGVPLVKPPANAAPTYGPRCHFGLQFNPF